MVPKPNHSTAVHSQLETVINAEISSLRSYVSGWCDRLSVLVKETLPSDPDASTNHIPQPVPISSSSSSSGILQEKMHNNIPTSLMPNDKLDTASRSVCYPYCGYRRPRGRPPKNPAWRTRRSAWPTMTSTGAVKHATNLPFNTLGQSLHPAFNVPENMGLSGGLSSEPLLSLLNDDNNNICNKISDSSQVNDLSVNNALSSSFEDDPSVTATITSRVPLTTSAADSAAISPAFDNSWMSAEDDGDVKPNINSMDFFTSLAQTSTLTSQLVTNQLNSSAYTQVPISSETIPSQQPESLTAQVAATPSVENESMSVEHENDSYHHPNNSSASDAIIGLLPSTSSIIATTPVLNVSTVRSVSPVTIAAEPRVGVAGEDTISPSSDDAALPLNQQIAELDNVHEAVRNMDFTAMLIAEHEEVAQMSFSMEPSTSAVPQDMPGFAYNLGDGTVNASTSNGSSELQAALDDMMQRQLQGDLKQPDKLPPCAPSFMTALEYKTTLINKCTKSVPDQGNCPHCSQYFEDLREHVYSTHLRPQQCPQCVYRAATKYRLEQHVRDVHVKFRPFQCPHCAYRSKDNFTMTRHIRRRHGPEPPTRMYC